MPKKPNQLIQELSVNGYTIQPQELTLTAELEFEFASLAIKFAQHLEADIKSKKVARRMTINEYIGRSAQTIIGGRKENVQKKLSSFVNTLDFRTQSKDIDLYGWIFDVNAGIQLIQIHNVIIKKFSSYNRDFMNGPKNGLKNHSHPLKDIIDIVGKQISPKSLKIFIEMIEGNPRTASGGMRDKKIPAGVVIRASLQAVHESSASETKQTKNETQEVFEYNSGKNDYYVRGKPREPEQRDYIQEEDEDYDEDDYNDERDQDMDSDDLRTKKKHDDDMKELTKIAHRYVFGNRGGLDELKKQVEQQLVEEDLTEEELLEKKLNELEKKRDEAEERSKQYDKLYDIVLELFNKAKYNYTQFGKEIRYIENLCTFFETIYDGDKTIIKDVRHIKREEVPDMKKLKLVVGKCLERASKEIYNDNVPVFKFAIDKEDYENDIEHKKKEAEFFELLNKSPPVPDQKGLKNARVRLREFQGVDHSSPLKKGSKHSTEGIEGEDMEEFMFMLKSEYYKDYKQNRGGHELQDYDSSEDEEIVDEDLEFDKTRMPPNILKGVALLFLRMWKSKGKVKRRKSRSSKRSKSRSSLRSKSSKKSSSKKKSAKKKVKKGSKSRSSSRSRSKSKKSKSKTRKTRIRTKEATSKQYQAPNQEESLRFDDYQNTDGLNSTKVRRNKANNWEDDEPIFRSPGHSPERSLDGDNSSPNKKSVNFAVTEKQVIKGPTIEDPYSIPKKRKKVAKRVPKKTGAYGSSSKQRSKSRSSSRSQSKKKTLGAKKATISNKATISSKVKTTTPGFSASVKVSNRSKSPGEVKKRKVGKFQTKAKF